MVARDAPLVLLPSFFAGGDWVRKEHCDAISTVSVVAGRYHYVCHRSLAELGKWGKKTRPP